MSMSAIDKVKTIHKVPVSKLRKETDPSIFPFETTAELERCRIK